jgi:hypothetical protein
MGARQGQPETHEAAADNLDMASDIDYGLAAATRCRDKVATQLCLIFKQLRQSDGKYTPLLVAARSLLFSVMTGECPTRVVSAR